MRSDGGHAARAPAQRPARMIVSRRAAIALGGAAALVVAALLLVSGGTTDGRVFEIRMRSTAGNFAEIWWDLGSGFSPERSARLPLARTPDAFQSLRFKLPAEPIRHFRFDPIDGAGEVFIDGVSVLDSDGKVIRDLNPRSFLPISQIASVKREGRLVHIVSDTAAHDPYLLVTPACLERRAPAYALSSVTPFALLLSCALSAGIGLASLVAIVTTPRSHVSDRNGRQWRPFLWLATLFLVTFSAKLLLIHSYPARVPFLDQWDAEAAGLYIPFDEGCLSWQQMFTPHNEHRVFFTRLLALALLTVNGQWDPVLQQVVNAALHALTAVAIAIIFWHAADRRRLDVVALLCAVCFALPFSWENTLAGFQSAFYFLLLFFVLSLGLTTRRVLSAAWWLGWSCVFCGLFTAAGGLLTVLAVGIMSIVRRFTGRSSVRETAANLALAVILFGYGLSLTSPPIEQHASLKAQSTADLMIAFARNLAWPWIDTPAMFVVVWLPVILLIVAIGLRRHRTDELDVLAVGLAAWVVLQSGAVAYGRGAGAAAPASRYMDVLALGWFANGMVFASLADRLRGQRIAWLGAVVVFAGWATWGIAGATKISKRSLAAAGGRSGSMTNYEHDIRRFLKRDDLATFVSKQFPEVPHWNATILANAWLRHPYIRRILPPAIRDPLPLTPRPGSPAVFVENGFYPTTPLDPLRHALGSFNAGGNPAQGRFESAPLRCELGSYLSFDVAGYLGQPGLSLSVVSRTNQETWLQPDELPMERWIPTLVACPTDGFTVDAVDERPDLWFAFGDPVEVAWASALADWLIDRGQGLLFAALGLALLVARFE
jgi:hypothetical protein